MKRQRSGTGRGNPTRLGTASDTTTVPSSTEPSSCPHSRCTGMGHPTESPRMTQAMVLRRSLAHRWRRPVIGVVLLFLVVAAGIAWWAYQREALSRLYVYSHYGEAYLHYCETFFRPPESLADLEGTYNRWEYRKTELPVPGYPRPEYMPIESRGTAFFIVFVEPRTKRCWDRILIYSDWSGSGLQLERVSVKAAERLVAEDKKSRSLK